VAAAGLQAEVREHLGSPTILVNGKPTVPLVFFGWVGGASTQIVTLGPEWKQYGYTFVCPEDTDEGGLQFRVGGGPPGTVWVDDVRLYPGEKQDHPTENLARNGDFEGTRDEVAKAWTLFQRPQDGADVSWDLDPALKISAEQSLRITIRGGGQNPMHAHFFQSGITLKQGQRYTYSFWMKSAENRTVDFMALHQGPPWTIYGTEATSSAYASQVKLAAAAGVHIHSFGIDMPWPEPGQQPDWSGVDVMMETTLHCDPQALLLPRFGCAPPEWWLKAHPDDVMRFSDGKTGSMCMASEAWLKDCLVQVRALVRHCEEKYGDHLLGYHPCGQHTGEWFYERSWEPVLSDFAPAMSAGFRRWVRERYPTEAALRAAWADAKITFDTVAVPTAEEQLATRLGVFRDPQTERKVIDYFEYKQLAMEQPLEAIAHAIKEETQRKKLVTFFYGYTFDMHGLPMGPQTSGHLAMARMVRCPDVDILTSPISYNDRELGGAGMFMSAVDSVRGAGKLWLNEDDTRTYLTKPEDDFGRVDTPQGTFWVHDRNFAQLLPRRLACWYMDLGGVGWLNGADLWQNIAKLRAVYDQALPRPATFAPEIAVIVDEVSPYYTKCTNALLSPLVYQMRSQCYRLGAPVRIHLLTDLTAGKVPPAKAYLFLNCFHLTPEDRRAVASATKGRTAVWFYGAGFLTDTADDAHMAELTGLPIRRGKPQPGRITPDPSAGDLVAGVGQPFGTDPVLDPLWQVESAPGVRVIGRYADGSVAAAMKARDGGATVYLGGLHVPAKLLRNIIKHAGVHLYSDSDDVILADRDFLAIAATSAGTKNVVLPAKRTVTDALTGEKLGEGADRFTVNLQLGETRLLWLQ
jgi:hypothetical protein